MVLPLRLSNSRARLLPPLMVLRLVLFLTLVLGVSTARANPFGTSEPLRQQINRAWNAYLDAESAMAMGEVRSAIESLPSQAEPVATHDLVELYHLGALVALSMGEDAEANRMARQAVTINPNQNPSSDLGPTLRAIHQRWQTELGTSRIDVWNDGSAPVWVDGVAVRGQQTSIVPGPHLVQRVMDGETIGEFVTIDAPKNLALQRGFADTDPLLDLGPGDPIDPMVLDEPEPAPKSRTKVQKAKTGGANLPLLVGGSVGVAGGATVVALAAVSESKFKTLPYDAEEYDGCFRGSACYAESRTATIEGDATRIRTMYVIGYSILGGGVGLAGLSFLAAPDPVVPGRMHLSVSGRF